MPADRTATIDLRDIIGFSTVYIPRLMPWRDLTEILPFVDCMTTPW
jgi:hypothetical protein